MYCIQIFWFILLQSLQVCGMDESTDEKPYSIVIPVIVAISFLFCFLSIKSYRIPGYLVFQLCALPLVPSRLQRGCHSSQPLDLAQSYIQQQFLIPHVIGLGSETFSRSP